MTEFSTPAWVHQAIFYQIFPDRFAASAQAAKPAGLQPWDAPPTLNGFKGGDLLGVAERLDYLQDLGITALYFTPVFQSTANHRYHTHDYYQVDPLLGGNDALRRLLHQAHQRGMKVVLDGVFNHASRGFFQFNHILENGKESPYLDWFRIKGFPLRAYSGRPNYDCWWEMPALPEFNHANPQVRQFIYSVARYWLEQGIDGWRLDVPYCIDDDSFWQDFRQVVKSANPEAYIVGEIGDDATRWLKGDQFDGVMNYLLTYACWGFFGGQSLDRRLVGNWAHHAEAYLKPDAADFARQAQELLERYPRPAVLAQLNLLGSHDTARILTLLGGDASLVRLAVLFQMTYPGAPCIYYGDEIGLAGGIDPDCRRAFPWQESRWDAELLGYFKKCIALRKSHPALRSGDFRLLAAGEGLAAYLRGAPDAENLVVILNRSAQTRRLSLPVADILAEGRVLNSLLDSGTARVENGRLSGLVLPPLSGAVLK